MYKLIRKILFLLDPELAHNFVLFSASKINIFYPLLKKLFRFKKRNEEIVLNNCKFRNRLGLAAGMDKDGVAILFWELIGFSHLEIGTITPKPQKGNPKPRLYRLVKEGGLLNRMGFNNSGADKVKSNIQKARKKLRNSNFVLGVNIGKNKDTPPEKAVEDYIICFEKLFDVADYFTINISSPNTEGLRDLQNEIYLSELLCAIQTKNKELSVKKNVLPKEVFIKISPDLNKNEVNKIFEISKKHSITGFIATNTSTNHKYSFPVLKDSQTQQNIFKGGISGKPLKEMSNNILSLLNDLRNSSEYRPVLIASGGVFSKEDFEEKIALGASLVQVYTGFVYEGPSIIKKILYKD